jgi:hypothetical protein
VVAAIDTCDFFMIVASPNAASSINVSDEIYYAFGRRQEKHPNWIMPVRLEAVEPSQIHWQLGRYQYRDLMTPRGEADFEALLAEIAQSGREAQA